MTIINDNLTFLVPVPATKVSKAKNMLVKAPTKQQANNLAIQAMRQALGMPGFSVIIIGTKEHTLKPGDKLPIGV